MLVEAANGENWECICDSKGIEAIMSSLNVKGTREAQLHKGLERAAPYMDPAVRRLDRAVSQIVN